jgi:subtilisin-like proprotein convertase family protein
MVRVITLIAAVCLVGRASAQVMQGEPLIKPASAMAAEQMQALDVVPVAEMPPLDMKTIEEEDALAEIDGEAPRYAIPTPVELTPAGSGLWERVALPGGGERLVWRLRAQCFNAVSMNLGFTQYHLPPSASLFVHAPDHSFVIRPFTAADNADHGQLWTPPVPGNEAVIELSVDPREQHAVQLTLGSINSGYRGFMVPGANADKADTVDKSGSCNVDVICSQGDGWRDEISSVAVISTGGSRFCTGFMVNNVRQDLTPYFMTAAHCSVTASNAPSLVCYWNYENSTCRAPGSSSSGAAGNGQLTQFNTGATWLATHSPSDMTLTRLSASPNPNWYVSFAGWDRGSQNPTSSCCIHHPNTEEKRISFDNNPGTTTSYNSSTSPGDGSHIRVGNWEVGTTEPGSSGSPLFDQNHRVIGQLHGGSASCTSITNDFYGRFSVSWNGGGTNSTRLSVWLDPDGTGATSVDTISTRGISVSPSSAVSHAGLVGGPFSQLPYTYTLSNSTANGLGYTAALTSNIGLLINGGTSTVSGTVPASGSATVTVTAGAALTSKPAGVYTEDIVFTDLGNGVSRTIRHTVEIGQTGISITPATGLNTSGPVGGPFSATASYSVASTQPSPVNVSVTSNAAWITIDGGASANFTLSGTGASRSVVVGVDAAAAASLSAGLYTGTVTISNASGGSGSSTRAVQLDVGRYSYAATGLPRAINDNSSFNQTIVVSDDFCIADLDVVVDIQHTYIGDLQLDLTSPAGTVVRLHNNTGSTTDDIIATYDEEGGRAVDGPGALSDFDAERSVGTWTLRVADTITTDTGSLRSVSLRMAANTGACPQREVVLEENFNANPGWTTQGQWAFGTPTGGGASTGYKDPTSGKTGTNVYGYNLTGDYTNSMPAYSLTSTAFDCTGVTGARVSFWRWLGVETSTYDKASFAVSNDGTTWTTLWQNSATLRDTSWAQVTYDISAVADNQPTVYFRWIIGPTDTSVVYCGWNIDDLSISGFVAAPACPGDLDQNGLVDAGDIGVMLLGFGDCGAECPADLDGNGIVDAGDIGTLLLGFGTCP